MSTEKVTLHLDPEGTNGWWRIVETIDTAVIQDEAREDLAAFQGPVVGGRRLVVKVGTVLLHYFETTGARGPLPCANVYQVVLGGLEPFFSTSGFGPGWSTRLCQKIAGMGVDVVDTPGEVVDAPAEPRFGTLRPENLEVLARDMVEEALIYEDLAAGEADPESHDAGILKGQAQGLLEGLHLLAGCCVAQAIELETRLDHGQAVDVRELVIDRLVGMSSEDVAAVLAMNPDAIAGLTSDVADDIMGTTGAVLVPEEMQDDDPLPEVMSSDERDDAAPIIHDDAEDEVWFVKTTCVRCQTPFNARAVLATIPNEPDREPFTKILDTVCDYCRAALIAEDAAEAPPNKAHKPDFCPQCEPDGQHGKCEACGQTW